MVELNGVGGVGGGGYIWRVRREVCSARSLVRTYKAASKGDIIIGIFIHCSTFNHQRYSSEYIVLHLKVRLGQSYWTWPEMGVGQAGHSG